MVTMMIKGSFIAICIIGLGACSASPDDQLRAMYEYQKIHDPKEAKITADIIENREFISDDDKVLFVKTYRDLIDQRQKVGDMIKEGERNGQLSPEAKKLAEDAIQQTYK